MESPDLEWLKTTEGREWLTSDEGVAWQRTEDGWAWMHSADARKWFDELARHGWERFFGGEMPPPPEWAITPEVAPRIGDRIRLSEAVTASNGSSAAATEDAVRLRRALEEAGRKEGARNGPMPERVSTLAARRGNEDLRTLRAEGRIATATDF